VAVNLGYKNVYRDPYGFPEWQAKGHPINSAPAGLSGESAPPKTPGPFYGWAMVWTLLGIFAGGIALNLTPYVYHDPYHRFLFWGQAQGQENYWFTACYTWGLSPNSIWSRRGLDRRADGGRAQNPVVLLIVAGFWFCFQPLRVVGTASRASHISFNHADTSVLCLWA
jgi:thiol:disulfide interchange protein DsbD